jgi:transglutaminase-like putative cysteine protease
MKKPGLWLLTTFALLGLTLHGASAQDVLTEPEGDWIKPQSVGLPESIPNKDIDSGVHYLLYDEQILIDDDAPSKDYEHYTELVVNQKGLEYASQIQVQFDPDYQSLIFHKLQIIRGDSVIDKLQTAKFDVLQRESELEELIYNGRLTASVILDDVRVGDIINYSYTVEGDNPIYDGIFSFRIFTQWAVPLEKQYFRLVSRKAAPLYINTLDTDLTVAENQTSDGVEYIFESIDTEPLVTNTEAPEWHAPYGAIFFSESAQWSDVVNWALPLYEEALANRQGVKAIADVIRASTDDKRQQIVEALVYVQQEVRYMGIEAGVNSHRPSPAYETLNRRYGDCKDKAVLFIAILDELGISGYPALVNTSITKRLGQFPPHINAFNHVIVYVELGDTSFWLDPTRQYQYGDISDVFQPDYGFALVVRPGGDSLSEMDIDTSGSGLVVHDIFDLTDGPGKDAIFTSTSEYIGLRAELLRHQIESNGLSAVETSFTDFYQNYYAGIERIGDLQVNAETSSGRLEISEEFAIEGFWEIDEENNQYEASFYANLVSVELQKPEQLNRNSPYSLGFPTTISQLIEIILPEGEWQFDDENFVEDNDYFLYTFSVKYDDSQSILRLQYDLKIKTDHVAAADIQHYLDARDRMNEYASYGIFNYIDPALAAGSEGDMFDLKSIIFMFAFAGYGLALVFALISWRLESRRKGAETYVRFYPVSLWKLWVLSVVTFGIYTAYWFYRNWKYLKVKEDSSIMPVARSIFSLFWYYPLYRKLVAEQTNNPQSLGLPTKAFAIGLAILYFLTQIFGGASYVGVPLMLISPLLIVPLANYINHLPQPDDAAGFDNSRWKLRHYLLALFFIPVIIFSYGSEINLLPSSKVVDGRFVWQHDLKFMQRKGIVPADQDIILFYSDAVFEIREDGNGFTDTEVFSYWVDDDDTVQVRRSKLQEVEDIRTNFATEIGENTTFTIVNTDATEFVLYASSEGGGDREFDKRLRQQWRLARGK